MADLQEFNKFFTELQQEVASLTKQTTDLGQDKTKLEARVRFLNGSIHTLEDEIIAVKAKKQQVIDALLLQIAAHQKTKSDLEKVLGKTNSAIKLAKSKLEMAQKDAEAEVQRLENIISDKTHAITGLREEIEAARNTLGTIQDDIAATTRILESLNEEVKAKKETNAAEIATLNAEIAAVREKHRKIVSKRDDAQDELDDITQKVDEKHAELAITTKKHQDFIEYEKRSTAALEARETAILDKEKELDQRIVTALRRNGILEKTS